MQPTLFVKCPLCEGAMSACAETRLHAGSRRHMSVSLFNVPYGSYVGCCSAHASIRVGWPWPVYPCVSVCVCVCVCSCGSCPLCEARLWHPVPFPRCLSIWSRASITVGYSPIITVENAGIRTEACCATVCLCVRGCVFVFVCVWSSEKRDLEQN